MTNITANYDQTWKEAIGQYFESFLQFFYPKIYEQIDWSKTPISLDKELEQITASSQTKKRYADKLFQVWLLNNEVIWILIHIEVQSQYDKEFPQRMFIYNYRSFDLFNKPVISLAILGDEDAKWRPNSYEYGIGDSEVSMKFSMVKLLDYQWEELAASNNLFAIIVMAHLKTKVTTKDLTQREQWKWNLVRPLYQKGLTKVDIINLVKFIDRMMTLPPPLQTEFQTKLNDYEKELNMPFLSTIEENAQEKGAKITRQDDIIKILSTRFDNLPEKIIYNIKQIDNMSILENLLLPSINVNSLEEFQTLIDAESQQK
ncbi:hypothetical protein BMF77_pc00051 (plasmid) [Dolichospermum sp. UHCC 0315A]|uniref:hypothetical protein n=1 Tax=Dolichospermum sp. UHCC 0315A TaxID=1914871 RepID=UPI0011E6CCF6|nr:hypothetical protein [Dolichospermum sp. UHCC 0315A]MDM3846092.1 hypothetical protein [Aphanizomenon gracile PMC638.10]MDM3860414.1 hypothetical protein [Aphanizomenon gracile PMC644.10]QEI44211.1 hypothetical protein BMF77_04842 [Dolichospermum sp. UHCC 0315A]QEI44482.1 hypothetical protein BMF77_pc00051 [Dolichospermum sp. UHCC 0315A]